MTAINIVVGSVYGGALQTARAIHAQLASEGHQALVLETPELADLTANNDPVLICTSTTGQGEVPPTLLPLYMNLRDTLPLKPGRPFGVIVLGDSSYGDTFCGAGDLMEEVFHEMAGRKVGDTLRIDALETPDPEVIALPWVREWIAQLP
ncbi:flavodoxin [Marinobacter caseinilyticus]|uniref:flavodoxin n=1 Tax=Marinobacter caseinilyticus TaxID=2692195 RepID=UPI001409E03D|nr:flavodoxin [Marinobacter caseinilyticus]